VYAAPSHPVRRQEEAPAHRLSGGLRGDGDAASDRIPAGANDQETRVRRCGAECKGLKQGYILLSPSERSLKILPSLVRRLARLDRQRLTRHEVVGNVVSP
jgi:hypothetical protein